MPRPSGWHRKPRNAASAARARQYASPEHRARRKTIQAQLDAGLPVHCWRCGRQIHRTFHLGHDDHNRDVYRGAECPPCNVKAAARKGARITNARRRVTPLRW